MGSSSSLRSTSSSTASTTASRCITWCWICAPSRPGTVQRWRQPTRWSASSAATGWKSRSWPRWVRGANGTTGWRSTTRAWLSARAGATEAIFQPNPRQAARVIAVAMCYLPIRGTSRLRVAGARMDAPRVNGTAHFGGHHFAMKSSAFRGEAPPRPPLHLCHYPGSREIPARTLDNRGTRSRETT
ncbi:hypothetical protein TVNIR_0967 [Thioalkalivibrio nitratireducens DSM 14787]|uniref:Uncharacterized protein n=1 Tax=Thioalkalivibrio nitratireducens (strain DSM 14787 / UNIQEM 213 / ALEN2) TaxID=1255043 RepID=L0DSR4_THIND|nr:hypothetical protein TVNIR_0967 [Thioalkalivibrio nitratireducens DSM 14787]